MNPVATKAQRAKTLRNIRHIEGAMLPPGWDAGLESQFGQALTAPQQAARTEAKQPTPRPQDIAPCGFGTCALNPECTRAFRYREAADALRGPIDSRHTQRAPMPPTPAVRTNPRARRITWALIALWCVGWVVGPIAWWLTR